MSSTERAFSDSINRLLSSEDKVVVAFSGGCDSLALLCLCVNALGTDRVFPVYVNHRLRKAEELDREIELNRSNCRTLGLELTVRSLDHGEVQSLASSRGGGVEDSARVLRYRILEEERVRTGAMYILTAHHRQDQVETIVMRLSKGSPFTSLKGISAVDEGRHLLRPLLGFDRIELEEYLREKGLKWSTDSTNLISCFARNSVRNEVIPKIQAIWPTFEKSILELGEKAARMESEDLGDIGETVSLSVFQDRDAMYGTRVLFSMWDALFPDRELPMTLVERVLAAVRSGENASVGANGAVFTLYEGFLYLTDPEEDAVFSAFDMILEPAIESSHVLPGGLVLSVENGGDHEGDSLALRMDPALFRGRVHVRFAKEGDRIRLRGGAKMVLRLLQDMKVPSTLRPRVPVLVDDDGVCAVFGRVFGGKDRICVKFVTSLARNRFPLYIVSKG